MLKYSTNTNSPYYALNSLRVGNEPPVVVARDWGCTHSRVSDWLHTWTIPAVISWCFDCRTT
jgi:hypothetical protein